MAAVLAIDTTLVVLLTVLVAGVLRSHAEILRAVRVYADPADQGVVEAGTPGEFQPTGIVEALGLVGQRIDGSGVEVPLWSKDDRDTVLAFLSTGCVSCETFWNTFGGTRDLGFESDTRVIIVAKDLEEESRGRLRRWAPAHHELVLSSRAWRDYRIPQSPYFIYIRGADARLVGEGSAGTWSQVLKMMGEAAEDNLSDEALDGVYPAGPTASAAPSGR